MVPSADKSIVRLWDDPNRRELSSVVDGKIAGFEDGRQITIFYPTSYGDSSDDSGGWCRTAWDNVPTSPDQIKAILIKSSDQATFRVTLVTAMVHVRNAAWHHLDINELSIRQCVLSDDAAWQVRVKIFSMDGQSTTLEVLTRKTR